LETAVQGAQREEGIKFSTTENQNADVDLGSGKVGGPGYGTGFPKIKKSFEGIGLIPSRLFFSLI
jgi:hypothetical protein